jgi:hypothetical protein
MNWLLAFNSTCVRSIALVITSWSRCLVRDTNLHPRAIETVSIIRGKLATNWHHRPQWRPSCNCEGRKTMSYTVQPCLRWASTRLRQLSVIYTLRLCWKKGIREDARITLYRIWTSPWYDTRLERQPCGTCARLGWCV